MSLFDTSRVRPPIRSSAQKYIADPFGYMLTERLGITSAFNPSKALIHGGWMHERLALYPETPENIQTQYDSLLTSRLDELRRTGRQWNLIPDSLEYILDDERQDAATAFGWFDAALSVRRPGSNLVDGVGGFLGRYRLLASELLTVVFGTYTSPLVAQFDLLLLDEDTNTLWVADLKSTRSVPRYRANYASSEYQTMHYLSVADYAIQQGLFDQWFTGPRPHLGGMHHIIIQKPPIRFGMNDRPFNLDTSPFQRGPRAGQPRNEKVYYGEPSLPNFIARSRDWYLGLGEYRDRSGIVFGSDCPVNISTTHYPAIPASQWDTYHYWTHQIDDLAARPVSPHNFPDNLTHYVTSSWSDDPPLTDFYLTPPEAWPEVMRRRRLTVSFRNPEIDSLTTSQLLGVPANV